jgi:hypothetical protein
MHAPTSFTQIEGWRESFDAARERLDQTRTEALFPEIPSDLAGFRVRAFTLRDWTVLEAAGNPFVVGGTCTLPDAANVVWQLRAGPLLRHFSGRGRIGKALRSFVAEMILRRSRYDELAAVAEISAFVDDAFLDMPGRFAKAGGASPTELPRYASEVSLCGEVMAQFPSFRFHELRAMPLAQFWQWMHKARRKEDPEYRNDQLTDEVNRRALGELRRLRKQASIQKNKTTP